MSAARLVKVFPKNCLFLICDLQLRLSEESIFFALYLCNYIEPAIYGFDHVVNTANKMVKVAKVCP